MGERIACLCLYFIELKKVYDSVGRSLLWRILARYGVPWWLIAVIRRFHDDFLVYLEDTITESSRLSAKIDRQIRAGLKSFNSYRAELYDRPTVSLGLKILMVKFEVVKVLYG